MIFSLDTNNYENIHLDLSEEMENSDIKSAVLEFCYGIASFITDFSMKMDCKTMEEYLKMKKLLIPCIEENVDMILFNYLDDNAKKEIDEMLQDNE
ncbi:MAG: hypothetical protein UIH27_15100 [Ruminococcus sp.]|nr:hypothetical protein [Ruminococcus sp.]